MGDVIAKQFLCSSILGFAASVVTAPSKAPSRSLCLKWSLFNHPIGAGKDHKVYTEEHRDFTNKCRYS